MHHYSMLAELVLKDSFPSVWDTSVCVEGCWLGVGVIQHWSSVKFLNWMRLYKPNGEVILQRGKHFLLMNVIGI